MFLLNPVVVLPDVEIIFGVMLVVITFVLTICDVVLLVYDLDELFVLDAVRLDAVLEYLM